MTLRNNFLATFALVILLVSGCKQDPCTEITCTPCPSNQLVIRYQRASGNCDSLINANTIIYVYSANDSFYSDLKFTYGFSDTCTAALLIDADYRYKIICSNPAFRDSIVPISETYQEPIEVTECCLCYPIATAQYLFSNVATTTAFPAGQYKSPTLIRSVP